MKISNFSDFKTFRRWSSSWVWEPSGWALLLPGSSIFIRCEYRKIQKNNWHLLGWRRSMAMAKVWLKSGNCTQNREKMWRCGSVLIIEPFFSSVSPAPLHASLAVQPGGRRWNRVWQGIGEQLEAPTDPQVALQDTKPFSAVAPFYKCKGRKQKIEKEKKASEKFAAAQAEMMPDTQEVDDETPEELEGEGDEQAMEARFAEFAYIYVLRTVGPCLTKPSWIWTCPVPRTTGTRGMMKVGTTVMNFRAGNASPKDAERSSVYILGCTYKIVWALMGINAKCWYRFSSLACGNAETKGLDPTWSMDAAVEK